MKKVLTLVFVIGFCSFLMSQTRKERKALKQAELEAKYVSTKALIDSGKFNFEALWANPLGNETASIGRSLSGGAAIFQGNRVSLMGNSNHVKINANSADIYLPYFGRVFFPNRMDRQGGGITYKGPLQDYVLLDNKDKKIITLKFKAASDRDNLQFIFRITAGGQSTLTVNSTNRQTISYDGSIRALVDESNN